MKGILLNEIEGAQDFCEEFKGYNHNIRRGAGEFYDMQNMTMDDYPVLATRKKRFESKSLNLLFETFPAYYPDGGKASPATIDGNIHCVKTCFDEYIAIVKGKFLIIIGDESVSESESWLSTPFIFELSEDIEVKRQLVYIGNFLAVFPDNKLVTMNKGSIDKRLFTISDLAESFTANAITVCPCNTDGETISVTTSKPEDSSDDYWYDTTDNVNELKKWSTSLKSWVPVDMYISIIFIGHDSPKKGQTFTVNIIEATDEDKNSDVYKSLIEFFGEGGENLINITAISETKRMIIKLNETNKSIFKSFNSGPFLYSDVNFEVKVIIPNFDYVCEGNNRIWGCRYGLDYKGDFVNEIYCSALGDFSSWYSYEGASTDSYTLSLGVEGKFLKAVFYNNRPVFFKENAILTIYGDYPANYQLSVLNTKGLQDGSSESVVVTENGIFYKGNDGVYLFDGSSPINISTNFGNEKYYNAVAGAKGYKYYISMQDKNGKSNLFVFDYSSGFWVKEDDSKAESFIKTDDSLIMLTDKFYVLEAPIPDEKDFNWFFETGTLGYSQAENKYIGRFNTRMSLASNTRVDLWIQYDSSGHWEHLGSMKGGIGLQSYNLPVVPHRCDHFNIKLSGKGQAKIFSIAKMLYTGGTGI